MQNIAFRLNFSPQGSLLNIEGSGISDGVVDSDNSTLAYGTPSTATTPEPTSIITLMRVGVLGLASKLKKKA